MGALRDLVAIVLLVIGPVLLIVGGIIILVTQPEPEPPVRDPIEEVIERASAAEPQPSAPKTRAMDHMLDGRDAFYQSELARDRGDRAAAERLLEAAITHFELAVSIDGNMAEAHRSLAVALDEAGREKAAIDHYRAYVVLEPESPDVDTVRTLIALREEVDDDSAPPAPAKPTHAKAEDVAEPSPVRKRLGRKDVLAVVNGNKPQMKACVVAARARGEIDAGRHKLTLEWTIEPEGTVAGARLLRPKKQRKTQLGRCVVGVLERWRFPASRGRTPITFPVAVRVD